MGAGGRDDSVRYLLDLKTSSPAHTGRDLVVVFSVLCFLFFLINLFGLRAAPQAI